MPIFKESKGKLTKLKAFVADKEKSLQTIIEKNLYEVLDMHFLASEYSTTGGRIDTLAVDSSGAPVIIEYKRGKNDNVINQGLSYLRWLQAQKQEFFEMLIIKTLEKPIADKIKVDWKNPRVICIATSYSKFDIDTVEVVPMRIELYRYRYYEDGLLSLEPINISEQKDEVAIETGKATIINSVEGLLGKANEEIQGLFYELRSRIKELDENIEEKATSLYVAYRMAMTFVEVHIRKSQLALYLRPIKYNDPKNLVEKISDGYNWTLNKRVYAKNIEDIEYILELIKQSYNDVL